MPRPFVFPVVASTRQKIASVAAPYTDRAREAIMMRQSEDHAVARAPLAIAAIREAPPRKQASALGRKTNGSCAEAGGRWKSLSGTPARRIVRDCL